MPQDLSPAKRKRNNEPSTPPPAASSAFNSDVRQESPDRSSPRTRVANQLGELQLGQETYSPKVHEFRRHVLERKEWFEEEGEGFEEDVKGGKGARINLDGDEHLGELDTEMTNALFTRISPVIASGKGNGREEEKQEHRLVTISRSPTIFQSENPMKNSPIPTLKKRQRKQSSPPPLIFTADPSNSITSSALSSRLKAAPKRTHSPPPRNPHTPTVSSFDTCTTSISPKSNAALPDNNLSVHSPIAADPKSYSSYASDEDDDGYGINGIGYRPTPAQAYARTQKRKQQVLEWRTREGKEARQRRSQRRRGEDGDDSGRGEGDREKAVRFA